MLVQEIAVLFFFFFFNSTMTCLNFFIYFFQRQSNRLEWDRGCRKQRQRETDPSSADSLKPLQQLARGQLRAVAGNPAWISGNWVPGNTGETPGWSGSLQGRKMTLLMLVPVYNLLSLSSKFTFCATV